MATLDTVKTALRIKHSKLDDELTRQIAAARLDLIRVGADANLVNCVDSDGNDTAENGLVLEAIVTYCLMRNTENSDLMEKYKAAYNLQADGIRKAQNV